MPPKETITHANRIFSGETFTGTPASWEALNCTFDECSFDHLRCNDFSFGTGGEPSVYRNCQFRDIQVKLNQGDYMRFEDCLFENCIIKGLSTHSTTILNCTFSGKWERCIISTLPPLFTNNPTGLVSGNDWRRCVFSDVSFRGGIDLTQNLLPSADNVIYQENFSTALECALKYLQGLPEQPGLTGALSSVELLAEESYGQKQLFFDSSLALDGEVEWRLLREAFSPEVQAQAGVHSDRGSL